MMESPRAEQRLIEIQQLYDSSDRGEPQGQSYSHIFQQFVWMGWSAFGGPSAHIGLFQKVSLALTYTAQGHCVMCAF